MKKTKIKKDLSKKIKEIGSENKVRGITLISLVISIVILLILSSIIIFTLKNQNIMNKAKVATETYKNKVNEEQEFSTNFQNKLNEFNENEKTNDYEAPKINKLEVNTDDDNKFVNKIKIEISDNINISELAITKENEEPKEWISTNKIDLSNIEIKQQYGAVWAKVFYHNNMFGSQTFASDDEVLSCDSLYKYSILNRLEEFRNENGEFEFLLQYPYDTTQYNRWIQTDNPATVTVNDGNGSEVAGGYKGIHIDWTNYYWGGLTKSTTPYTFIDGSVGHSNWYYAIGLKEIWCGGAPKYDDYATTSVVELWVRIDNLNQKNVANKNNKNISTSIDLVDGNGEYKLWTRDSSNNVSSKSFTINNKLNGVHIKEQYGAKWVLVFLHNNLSGAVLFNSANEALNTNSSYKYSILNRLEEFRNENGEFEFLLQYPYDTTQYNRWIQTDNPATVTVNDGNGSEVAGGYRAIHIDWTNYYWGGLTKSTSPNTFIDGSVGHSNWYYAIGCYVKWGVGIPKNDDYATASVVELWTRID